MTDQKKATCSCENKSGKTIIPETALLDINQVASILNCSSRHVQRMVDAGRMPKPLRLGYLVRWDKSTIKEWISQGCPQSQRESHNRT